MDLRHHPGVIAPMHGRYGENEGRLKQLEAEDLLSVVRFTHRKMARHGEVPVLSEEEAVAALRQYYALPILEYPRQQFAISSIVDTYWHTHVLDTRGWRDFCQRVYGRMMHHVPLDPDNYPDFARVRALYIETRTMLTDHFGEQVSDRAYPHIKGDGHDVVICSYDYCITKDLFDE
ncbi:hypothetical protein K2Q16_03475 [Patescibacteria group bacterium]|nr:hypothetical protein [Patescibacteria group bacterium]